MLRILPPSLRHTCHRAGARCPLCQRAPLGVWQRRAEVLLALLEGRAGLGLQAIQAELRWLRRELVALLDSLRAAGFTPATLLPLEDLASDLALADGPALGCWEVTRLWERADLVLRGFAQGDDLVAGSPPRRERRFWR